MKELINFIDKSLTQSFKLPDSERSSFLALSLLSMRDFVSKELNVSIIKTKLSSLGDLLVKKLLIELCSLADASP